MNEKFQKIVSAAENDKWFRNGWPKLVKTFAPILTKKKGSGFLRVHSARTSAIAGEQLAFLMCLELSQDASKQLLFATHLSAYVASVLESIRKRLMLHSVRSQPVELRFVELTALHEGVIALLLEIYPGVVRKSVDVTRLTCCSKAAEELAERFVAALVFFQREGELLSMQDSSLIHQSVSELIHHSKTEAPSVETNDIIMQSIGVH